MSGKRHQQWASEECVACLNGFTVGMHIAVGYLGLLVTWRRFHSHQLELKNFDIVIWVAEAPWNSHHSSLSQHFMAIFRWFWCSFICAGTTPQIHKRWGPMMPFGWARWGFCPSCVEWMSYAWRWQVLNSRANPAHPYHRFGTGNFKTLLEDTAAKGAALWKIDICGKLVKSTGLRYRKPTRSMCNLESWLQGVRIAWCRPGINLRAELLAYYQRYLALRGKQITGTSRMFTTSLWSQVLFGDVVGTRIWRCSLKSSETCYQSIGTEWWLRHEQLWLSSTRRIAAGEDIIAPRWWRFASSARNLWPSCKVFSSAVQVWSCLVFRVPPQKNEENSNITQFVTQFDQTMKLLVRLFVLLCFVLFLNMQRSLFLPVLKNFKSPSGAWAFGMHFGRRR